GEDAIAGIARYDAVAHDEMHAVAGRLARVHPQPDDVVLQMDAIEDDIDGERADGRDQDAAGPRGAAVVEDEGVGDEQLRADLGLEQDAESALTAFVVPDHAVLDVHGRGPLDVDAHDSADLPVDDEAAQADDVAVAGADDHAAGIENGSLAGAVVGDM